MGIRGGFVTELAYAEQKVSTNIRSGTVNNDRLNIILTEISKNNKVSIEQLAKAGGVSRRTLIRDLDKLKELGQLIRVGSDKGGYWEVLNF